jgi:rod shape-determining protein MreC
MGRAGACGERVQVAFREGPFGDLKVPLTWTAAVALIVAVVVAVALLLADRRETVQSQAYGVTREAVDKVAAPVGGVVAAPGRWGGEIVAYIRSYFFVASENRRLKAELVEARQWRDTALKEQDQNDRFRSILGLKVDPPIPMVTARVITESRGPFANTRLADAGSEKQIVVGNPVMSENGLIGRVVGVGGGVSRVLLLTDVESKTPVMIDRTNARAILTGDGGPNPKLAYLRGREPVKAGDRVVTSGDGGVLPRGLPVGVAVQGLGGEWRVSLDSDRAPIDYVRILLFKDFSQLNGLKALQAGPMPPVTTEDPQGRLINTPSAAPAGGAAKPAVTTPPSSSPQTPLAPGAKPATAKPATATAKPAPTPSKPAKPVPQGARQ